MKINAGGWRITDPSGSEVITRVTTVDWDAPTVEKGYYPHFMQKEISEQPDISWVHICLSPSTCNPLNSRFPHTSGEPTNGRILRTVYLLGQHTIGTCQACSTEHIPSCCYR